MEFVRIFRDGNGDCQYNFVTKALICIARGADGVEMSCEMPFLNLYKSGQVKVVTTINVGNMTHCISVAEAQLMGYSVRGNDTTPQTTDGQKTAHSTTTSHSSSTPGDAPAAPSYPHSAQAKPAAQVDSAITPAEQVDSATTPAAQVDSATTTAAHMNPVSVHAAQVDSTKTTAAQMAGGLDNEDTEEHDGKSNKWTEEMTDVMKDLITEKKARSKFKTNTSIYREVAEELSGKFNREITATQIANRLKTMGRRKRAAEAANSRTGGVLVEVPHESQLNELASADDSRVPLVKLSPGRVEFPQGKELATSSGASESKTLYKRRKLQATSTVLLAKLTENEEARSKRHAEKAKQREEKAKQREEKAKQREEKAATLDRDRRKSLELKEEKNDLLRQLLVSRGVKVVPSAKKDEAEHPNEDHPSGQPNDEAQNSEEDNDSQLSE